MEEQSWCRWRICALTSALLLAVGFIAAGPLAQAQESAPPSIDVEELLAPYRDGLKDAMPAYSDEREAIVSYEVDATVLPNTDMRVDELITYNTGTDKVRHGLIRDIPTIDVLDNGMQRSYDISLIAVSRDGREVPYTVDDSGGALSLRIGDERVAILGRHEFRITYLVKYGLDVLQESDLIDGAPPEVSAGDVELYWDFVGDEWAFPVYEADVSIIGPAPALAAQCDADPGYGQGCAVDLNGGPRGATTMRASAMGWPWIEGYLSGVIAWAPDAFTQLPTPVISEPPQAAENTRAVRNLRISALLGLAALAIPIVIAITLRRRSRGVVLAASPVRFEPPSSLRPAELQAGMEGAVTASGIAATLLDLAARGHVTITEGERRLFQADGLELTRTGQGKDSLQGWEKLLLDTTFKGEGQATIGDFDPELGRAIKVISSQLGAAGRSSGFYNPDGYRPDRPYRILALVGILGAALAFGILVASGEVRPTAALAAIVPASAGLIIGGVVGALITPRRQTSTSATFIAEVEGFRRFMDSDSAAARRDYVQRSGLPEYAVFSTYLPYAIALGLEEIWIENFPDLDPSQLSRYGIRVASWGGLSDFTSSMTSSVSSGTTTRSGGSGFGGRAGGGGGGGGGGSF